MLWICVGSSLSWTYPKYFLREAQEASESDPGTTSTVSFSDEGTVVLLQTPSGCLSSFNLFLLYLLGSAPSSPRLPLHTNPPVDLKLHLTLTCEQIHQILELLVAMVRCLLVSQLVS